MGRQADGTSPALLALSALLVCVALVSVSHYWPQYFSARAGQALDLSLNGPAAAFDPPLVEMIKLAAAGLVGLLKAMPGVTPIVTVLAAAYFLYLAWRIAMAPPLTDDHSVRRAPTFIAGLALSLVNPKGYAAMAALYSGFILVPDRLGADIAAKMAVLTVIIAAVNVAWLLAGAGLTRFFRDPRSNRLINVAFAVLLVASVVLAFV